MTDPAGNSEFCFLKTLNVSRGDTEWSRVKQNSLTKLPQGQSLNVLLYLQLKSRKKLPRNHLLYAGWFTNLPKFQGARPDHMRVETVVQVFISLDSKWVWLP